MLNVYFLLLAMVNLPVIGGTVKRVVYQESIKQVTTGQILDVNLMYSFCKTKITGVCFKLFSKEEINETRAHTLSGHTYYVLI